MGWSIVRIGDICRVDWGNTSLTKKSYTENGDYLGVSAAGCDGRMTFFEHEAGTPVLSAIGANCGRMFLPKERFTAIKNTITLTPNDSKIKGRFLYYLLKNADLPKRGAGQPFISKGDINAFEVTLPPIPEQQRIVAILDQAFADIDKARANAEKNLKNARELFDSYLNQVFSQRGEGWVENKLEDVCILQRGFDLPTRLREKGTHPLVSSSGTTDLIDQYKVCGPGVVTGRSGSIGKVFYIEDDFWPLNTTLYIKEFHGNDKAFVFWLLKHFDLSRFTSGAGVPTLNRNSVHNELVWLPRDIATQKRIVKSAEILESKMNQLTTLYNDKKDALEELKKSLLQKAFSGELTKTEGHAA